MKLPNIREWKVVFHFPLPLAVVALTTIGACVSPQIHIDRLIITYLLILFGLVFAAYSFDALASDWKFLIRGIQQWQLILLALIGLMGFIGISIYATIKTSLIGILVALVLITFIVTYNLEVPKWLHNKWGFAISWGGFVTIASYYYQSLQISLIMIPLFLTGFLFAIMEYHTTNTHSILQRGITSLNKEMPERKLMRKETFTITSLMCYSLFTLSMTLLMYRLL